MGRGKRSQRSSQAVARGPELPLSDGERSSRSAAPVTPVEPSPLHAPPHYHLEALNELRRGLPERIEREMDYLGAKESLYDYMGENHPEGPLRWFVDYLVYDECAAPPALAKMSLTIDDANEDDLDGVAVIFPDAVRAEEEPTPGMRLYVDWGSYRGQDGVAELVDQFYSAFDRLADAYLAMPKPAAPVKTSPEILDSHP